MKQKNIYLQAAKAIHKKKLLFCCEALFEYTSPSQRHLPIYTVFARYFRPENSSDLLPWFDNPHKEKNQEHRIMSLLLMHEITKGVK